MTKNRKSKQSIRAAMQESGSAYNSARRSVTETCSHPECGNHTDDPTGQCRLHRDASPKMIEAQNALDALYKELGEVTFHMDDDSIASAVQDRIEDHLPNLSPEERIQLVEDHWPGPQPSVINEDGTIDVPEGGRGQSQD